MYLVVWPLCILSFSYHKNIIMIIQCVYVFLYVYTDTLYVRISSLRLTSSPGLWS